MTTYKAKIIEHEGKQRIAVEFENKLELINRFKKLTGRKWSTSLKVWNLPENKKYRKQFGLPLFKTR